MLIPAIDLIDGACVRLHQGDYQQKTIYSADPAELAKQFEHDGAPWLHIIDLDGAKAGYPVNQQTIQKIKEQTSLKIQVGGGLRTAQDLKDYQDFGIDQLIISTSALQPEMLQKMIQTVGANHLTISLDVRNEKIAINGWLKQTKIELKTIIAELERQGIQRFIITDISRDGTMQGINEPLITSWRKLVQGQLLIAGGVKSIDDLKVLQTIGIDGAISGSAVLQRKIVLKEWYREVIAKSKENQNLH